MQKNSPLFSHLLFGVRVAQILLSLIIIILDVTNGQYGAISSPSDRFKAMHPPVPLFFAYYMLDILAGLGAGFHIWGAYAAFRISRNGRAHLLGDCFLSFGLTLAVIAKMASYRFFQADCDFSDLMGDGKTMCTFIEISVVMSKLPIHLLNMN